MDEPGPSKKAEADHPSTSSRSESLSGMKAPKTLSEWQLQAVLFKAKLTDYFETFISLGGDDIDQIMGCDEQEFLEIMSLVGMAQKPLHVRRLQRTLAEFSADRARFLREQLAFLGPPPVAAPSAGPSERLTAALRLLTPGPGAAAATVAAVAAGSAAAAVAAPPPPLAIAQQLLSLRTAAPPAASTTTSARSPDQPGTSAATADDLARLTADDLAKLSLYVMQVMAEEPIAEPRVSKRQVHKNRLILEVMSMPADHPQRAAAFRKYSAIYGRYDTKRLPNKPLTFHELLINEAAAQICLLRPAMLTRRDRLFTLARLAVRMAGFPGIRTMKAEARPCERSDTPQSNITTRSMCNTPIPDDTRSRSPTKSVEPDVEEPQTKKTRPQTPSES